MTEKLLFSFVTFTFSFLLHVGFNYERGWMHFRLHKNMAVLQRRFNESDVPHCSISVSNRWIPARARQSEAIRLYLWEDTIQFKKRVTCRWLGRSDHEILSILVTTLIQGVTFGPKKEVKRRCECEREREKNLFKHFQTPDRGNICILSSKIKNGNPERKLLWTQIDMSQKHGPKLESFCIFPSVALL